MHLRTDMQQLARSLGKIQLSFYYFGPFITTRLSKRLNESGNNYIAKFASHLDGTKKNDHAV